MAKSKIFEALMEESSEVCKKGGDLLKEIQATGKETEQLTERQTEQLNDKPNNKPNDRRNDKPNDRRDDRRDDRLYQKRNTLVDIVISNPVLLLTKKQAIVLDYLIDKKNKVSQLQEIVSVTGVKYGTVRGILRFLTNEHYISKPERYKKGQFYGFKYTLNETICSDFKSRFHNQRNDQRNDQLINRQITERKTGPIIEEEDINILLLLNREKIKLIYPTLYAKGFEQKHLKELADAWNFQKFTLDDFPDSLERAEWAVKHNDKIKDPLNYVYSALMKGPFAKPAGFVSRAECEAQEKVKEAKRIQALNEEAETLEFENWWRGLPKGEQEGIDATAKVRSMAKDGPAIRGHRMNCFRERQGYGTIVFGARE